MSEDVKKTKTGRIPSLDYFRGIVIFLMIQGHLFRALLEPGVKKSSWFPFHEFIHGVVAPGFLFLAGYLFFHTIHNKRKTDFLTKARQLGGIVLLGYFLHLPFFSLTKIIEFWGSGTELKLFRMDILQTIGFSLLIALLIWVFLRRFFIPGIAVLAVFNIIAPFVYTSPADPFLASFTDSTISQFPLVPWSFYLFLGILVSRFLKRTGVLLLAAGVLLMFTAGFFPAELIKTAADTGKVLTLFVLVRMLPETGSPLLKRFLTASRESLFLYMSHLMVVYGSPINPGLSRYLGGTLTLMEAILLLGGLCLALYPAAYYLNRYKSGQPDTFNRIKYAMFTFFGLVFLLSKW